MLIIDSEKDQFFAGQAKNYMMLFSHLKNLYYLLWKNQLKNIVRWSK